MPNNTGQQIVYMEFYVGWNLISSPYEGWDLNKAMTERNLSYSAFGYSENNYSNRESTEGDTLILKPGKTYWLFLYGSDNVMTIPVYGNTSDKVKLYEGWNMIGPKSPVLINELFGLNNQLLGICWVWNAFNAVYQVCPQIELGNGYWIYFRSGTVEEAYEITF